MTDNLKSLRTNLEPLLKGISEHALFPQINSISQIRIFMQEHVFAVWDFMCLIKELNRRLVCTQSPWLPPIDAFSAHLIGEILIEEESDLAEDGVNYACHYDTYLLAMEKIGADTTPIKKLLSLLSNGHSIEDALDVTNVHPATKKFVLTTFSFFNSKLHEIAAAFVYGREGLTSAMFAPLLAKLQSEKFKQHKNELSTLIFYLERHIELDQEDHFPKALQMLDNLTQNDPQKITETEAAAIKALNARNEFLNSIQNALTNYQTPLRHNISRAPKDAQYEANPH